MRRRVGHDIRSQRDLAARSGLSRDAVKAAEAGTASENTFAKLEAYLDSLDQASSSPIGVDEIEFDITGPTTAFHVVVRTSVENADLVRHQVAELMRELNKDN